MSDNKIAATKRSTHTSRISDGVEFTVGKPKVFLWTSGSSIILIGGAAARRTVVAN
jgi:hypothetical protein